MTTSRPRPCPRRPPNGRPRGPRARRAARGLPRPRPDRRGRTRAAPRRPRRRVRRLCRRRTCGRDHPAARRCRDPPPLSIPSRGGGATRPLVSKLRTRTSFAAGAVLTRTEHSSDVCEPARPLQVQSKARGPVDFGSAAALGVGDELVRRPQFDFVRARAAGVRGGRPLVRLARRRRLVVLEAAVDASMLKAVEVVARAGEFVLVEVVARATLGGLKPARAPPLGRRRTSSNEAAGVRDREAAATFDESGNVAAMHRTWP